jgi:hypothetical protein
MIVFDEISDQVSSVCGSERLVEGDISISNMLHPGSPDVDTWMRKDREKARSSDASVSPSTSVSQNEEPRGKRIKKREQTV